MIYVTGDTHGDFTRFSPENFPEQETLTKEDTVIICGDFGGIWYPAPREEEDAKLDWLEERPFTTVFVSGNHENFDRLYDLPRKKWNGGEVAVVRPSVFLLMRGNVYTIEGKKFFAFGGASSHDVEDGIVDVTDFKTLDDFLSHINELEKAGKDRYRIRCLSWWDEELPSRREMEKGLRTLAENDWRVDYVITHCAPGHIQEMILKENSSDVLTDYFDSLKDELEFGHWYFGHYHEDAEITDRYCLLYKKIEKIL